MAVGLSLIPLGEGSFQRSHTPSWVRVGPPRGTGKRGRRNQKGEWRWAGGETQRINGKSKGGEVFAPVLEVYIHYVRLHRPTGAAGVAKSLFWGGIKLIHSVEKVQ